VKWKDPKYLEREYVVKERSTSDIAAEHGVFPNTIRRELKKHGFKIRDKSAAQQINIKKNGAPMEGRKRSTEEKEKISEGLQRFWDELGDTEATRIKKKRARVAKEKWESLSDEEKTRSIKKMHNASRNRMYLGSKNENMVARLLEESGFVIEQRSREYTPGQQFEIDIVLPNEQIAIEWDGATHFDPIYGEEHLAKVQDKDDRKNKV